MSVEQICQGVDQIEQVRQMQKALHGKERKPFDRFNTRMTKELVFGQHMDFKQAQSAIADQWKHMTEE